MSKNKHEGGDGDTMKNAGNWLGNSKKDTEALPKQESKKPEKGPEHKDIMEEGK